jgi:hypothetical protein
VNEHKRCRPRLMPCIEQVRRVCHDNAEGLINTAHANEKCRQEISLHFWDAAGCEPSQLHKSGAAE